MRSHRVFFLRRALKDEHGQVLPATLLGLVAFIGFAGLSIEVGHGYYAVQKLQASTNAAALAGAAYMPTQSAATTAVTKYSSKSTDENANPIMTVTGLSTTFKCSSSTALPGCETDAAGDTAANEIIVTQSVKVPLWFGSLFGVPNFNISATATAAMRGGPNTPYNIAIIVDTTASMASGDSGVQCSGTQISCALQGVQSLLKILYPCELAGTCTSSSIPVDTVSLFVFPGVTTATQANDYNCPHTSNPSIVPYTFQNVTTGSSQKLTQPSTNTYQITAWSTNYKISDTATTLNAPTSQIVDAAGGDSGCAGITAPGGYGTYYAQTIYAAQAALVAEAASYPGSQNAMIILSDGDATACASSANTSAGGCNSKADLVAQSGTLNGTGSNTTVTYPSALGECGQAVVAAQAATAAGTKVYTVGYGAETSGACLTDKSYSASPTTPSGAGAWAKGDQPCAAMAAMASNLNDFYSDDGAGCVSTDHPTTTKLTAIFQNISAGLTVPRLVPNGT